MDQGHTLDELITGQGKQPSFGHPGSPVFSPSDTLQKRGDGTCCPNLTNEIDRTDIDSQFQRRGGHKRFELAVLELVLRIQTQLRGEASMMGCDIVLSKPFAKLVRDTLGQPSCID